MIKAIIAFPSLTNVYARFLANVKRYLPDDVDIVEVLDIRTKSTHQDYDVVVTYNGNGSYFPQNAFISPKAVISERADDITMSYYTERDVMFSYNYTDIARWQEAGKNACLWPRPINPELFYPDSDVKDKLVMTVGFHGDWIKYTDRIVSKLGGRHLVMALPQHRNILSLKAEYDYCWPDKRDNELRCYYSSSKYVVSFVSDYEYLSGYWSCGIELGLAEAVFCGSVPMILQSKHTDYMHKWLDGLAIWIDPDNFDEEVEAILAGPYTPITKEQQVIALERFGAENVMGIFWDAIRKVLQ